MTAPGGSSPMRIGGAALLAAGVIAGIIGLATVIGDGDEGVSTAAPGITDEASETAAAPPSEPAPGSGPVPVPSFGAPPPPGGAAPPPGVAGGDGGTGSDGTGSDGSDGTGGAGSGTAGSGGTGSGTAGSGGTGSGGAGSGGTGSGTAGSGGTGSGGTGSGGTGSAAGSGATSGGKGTGTGGPGGSTAGRSGGASAPQAARMPLRVYNNSMIPGLAAEAERDFESAGWTVTEVGNYNRGIIPTSTVYYRPGTAEQASAERLAAEFGLRANPRFEGIEDATPGLIVILTRDYQRR